MTISTLYVILLVSHHLFRRLKGTSKDTAEIFHIPQLLQQFISFLYYWPDISVDGIDDVELVTSGNHEGHFNLLRESASVYTSAVASYMRRFGKKALLRDRPNSHRLTELALHSVPLFGHGRLLSELVLELTRALFKTFFRENTHFSSHLTAVDLFLSRVWGSNVYLMYQVWKNSSGEEKELAFTNLVGLFFGNEISKFYTADRNNPEMQDYINTFRESLDNIIAPPVNRMLSGSIPLAFVEDHKKWVPRVRLKSQVDSIDDVTKGALIPLSAIFEQTIEDVIANIVFYERAVWTLFSKYDIGTKSYPYRVIHNGTPVTFHVSSDAKESNLILQTSNGHDHVFGFCRSFHLRLQVIDVLCFIRSNYVR